MSLAVNFDNTLLVLRTLRSFPIGAVIINGMRCYGHDAVEVFTQLNAVFPGNGLLQTDIDAILARGAKHGVFRITCCAGGVPFYSINNAMVASCYRNIAYLQQCEHFTVNPGVAVGCLQGITNWSGDGSYSSTSYLAGPVSFGTGIGGSACAGGVSGVGYNVEGHTVVGGCN